ncbi:hypothetical protein F5Y04DRAFT_247438 [Hypomontagnella monticulosa]|nr:hypothetical protein F5Y04DRAFT_247438 [Hypomontagnella monticulosa]
MSVEATAAMASATAAATAAAAAAAPDTEMVEIEVANDNDAATNNVQAHTNKTTGLHSPPDSNSAMKLDSSDDSELSDLDDPSLIDINVDMSSPPPPGHATQHNDQDHESEQVKQEEEEDEDIGEVHPDHWSGTVPVFKPDMHQFKDFKKFMTKVDCYGMKSGIIKIIPPKEWQDQRPPLDDMIKQIRVKEPIKQDIMGSNGTYRQVNILHQRSYNIPQWRQLCDQSEHQPPARRGERRAQAPPKPKPASSSTPDSRKRGRPTRGRGRRAAVKDNTEDPEDRPMTPVSPRLNEEVIESVEQDPGMDVNDDDSPPVVGRMGGSRQAKPKTQSTSARRKYARREASAKIDEEAFREFDYRMDISDYTPERCEELERIYWKTLTYAPPLYGADLPGTLFEEDCDTWNLNRLPNLLDVLGTKVPGVNTAYLYLGMWKATFAWHLEDVDLYSINYLHFGAPKQWYSISQGDARRFEAAMKSIWPTEAKACDQFLRHKAFLISPNHLQQYYNIKVNKCVSYPGEFVVTYPYGYHSGYNLGYNCAEAVNFALDSWLPMGKIAKRCECAQAQDSVWVDVYEIERKLRGEETDYEETDEEDEEEEEEDDDLDTGVPTPQSSHVVRLKQPGRKRKRTVADKGEKKAKKVRLRVKNHIEPPCCLCPHDIPGQEVLPTSDGHKAHRICALYGAETWIETVDGQEVVTNVDNVSKARLELKCLYCRSKRGACFQCCQKKCARAYHATCAAAAGVLVEEAEVPIFGEDGTEYKEQAFEFTCRFHRTKRDKKLDAVALEECQKTRQAAAALKKGDICQLQYYRGDIFAGVIVESRADEQMFLIDVIPNGDRMEVEWKWLLLPDPADFHLPRASAKAIPMPTSRKAKDLINATKRVTEELPRADAPFVEGFTWAEFNASDNCANEFQARVDFNKENQIWHYLPGKSTDARAQYTEDPARPRYNAKGNFLDSVPRPAAPAVQPRKSYGSTFSVQTPNTTGAKAVKPYQYKPRDPVAPSYVHSPFTAQQFVPKPSPFTAHQFIPKPSIYPSQPPGPRLVPAPQQGTQYTPRQAAPKVAPLPQNGHYSSQPTLPKPASAPLQMSHYSYPPIRQSPSTTTSTPTPAPQQSSQNRPLQPTPQPTPTVQPPPPPPQQTVPKLAAAPQPSSQFPPPQTVLKASPIARPTPPQNGHKRNRSSLNAQGAQELAFGSDRRFRTPPFSYGSSGIDPNAKSPFSHGFMQPPGLGPSPSPQNGHLFQAQARARSSSLASNRSFDTPMTSSAIRPTSSTSAQGTIGGVQGPQASKPSQGPQAYQVQAIPKQTRPSIVQKYAFFQVHHNRDSTKYRTPYAHWGGFTNGYEGNLRAHLMRSPEALFEIRNRSIGFSGASSSSSTAPRIPFSNASNRDAPNTPSAGSYSSPRQTVASLAATPSPFFAHQATPTAAPIMPGGGSVFQQTSTRAVSSSDVDQGPIAQLHPAIRAQYAAMLQKRGPEIHDPQNATQTRLATPNQLPIIGLPGPLQPPSTPVPGSAPVLKSDFTQPQVDSRTPTSATSDQKPSTSTASSTRAPSVPKQTYIPPPRPWETLRKTQTPVQVVQQPPSPYPLPSDAAPAAAIPTASSTVPGPFVYNGAGNPRHVASPGLQPSNPQPDQSRAIPVQNIQPPAAIPPRLPATPKQSTTTPIQQPRPAEPTESAWAATGSVAESLMPNYVQSTRVTTSDLPEVPDDSMELIESIISHARRISDSYDTANGSI